MSHTVANLIADIQTIIVKSYEWSCKMKEKRNTFIHLADGLSKESAFKLYSFNHYVILGN